MFLLLAVDAPAALAQELTASDAVPMHYFGSAVDGAGDLDGDGFDDVAVGAYGDTNYTGAVYVYSGGPAGVQIGSERKIVPSDGTIDYVFGLPVVGAGDLNADGFADLAVSATGADGYTGAIYLYQGSASGPTGEVRLAVGSGATQDQLGAGLSGGGDIDGDGFDDLVAGAPGVDGPAIDAGAVFVYLGEGSLGALGEPAAVSANVGLGGQLGYAVSGGGDLDGDGYADVVAGAPGPGLTGLEAWVWLGGATGLDPSSAQRVIPSDGAGGRGFGIMVSTTGDLDGDGHADLVVGAPSDGAPMGAGAAYVYLGDSGGVDLGSESKLTAFDGSADDYFGRSAAIVEDTNGDAMAELLVGAYNHDSGSGAAYLFHGSPGGVSPDATKLGAADPATYAYFGVSLASAGDVDGDGSGDLIVGAAYDGHAGYASGLVEVIHSCIDVDLDGICASTDCDDLDDAVDDSLVPLHLDDDGDGFGQATTTEVCSGADGYVEDGSDCDDQDATTYPGAAEEESAVLCMKDADEDGFGDGDPPTVGDASIAAGADCDDADSAIHPFAEELRGDEIDSDCDGEEYCYADQDGDAYSDGRSVRSYDVLCDEVGEMPDGSFGDCDDTDATVHPGATDPCGDGRDSDCDGIGGPDGDEDGDGLTWMQEDRLGTSDCSEDSDGDGLGDAEEYDLGTDPALADTDGDGLPDGQDSDPLVPDEPYEEPSQAGGCSCGPLAGSAAPLALAPLLFVIGVGRRRRSVDAPVRTA